ncbi:hypothetical protein [Curtobacterium sp. MCBD17_003]|uniref:hypothetical protein n=1 Tax=Curtobacterium sp. MCBD17_003 TaxID=2175667 RepID=UPI000DA924CF|nr:hypothetical protein [Curtobacterium sp. MCBD17_003]WIE55644.1 hypothetical protein DEI88_005440 [Curtobacterium sp. MCBD17_003]
MSAAHWVRAALVGVGGFIAAYAIGILTMLLAALLAPHTETTTGSGTANLSDTLTSISDIAATPVQLILLADLGRLGISGQGALIVQFAGSIAIGFVPLFIAAAQIIAIVVLSRRITRPRSLTQHVAMSLLSGVVLAVLTLVAGLVLPVRIPGGSGAAVSTISGLGAGAVLVAFLVGAIASFLARAIVVATLSSTLAAWFGVVRVVMTQFAALTALVTVALIVVAAVEQNTAAPVLPLVIGNVAVVVVALGLLGGAGVSDSVGRLLSLGGSDTSTPHTLTVFSGTGWLWLAVLAAVVSVFLGGLGLAVRRSAAARPVLDWALTPAAYLLVGLLTMVLGTVVAHAALSAASINADTTASAGVTPWTPVVFVLWGGVAEVVARFVAPRVLPRVSPSVLAVASRVLGNDQPVFAQVRPRRAPVAPASASHAWPVQDAGATLPGGPDRADLDGWGDVVGPAPTSRADAVTDDRTAATAPAGPVTAASATGGAASAAPSLYGPADGSTWADRARPPLTPRARRVLVTALIGGGALIVVVVAGAITLSTLRASVWGPGPVARQFMQALSDGDARAAGDLSSVHGIGSGLLTDAVLSKATDRPSDVRIGTTTVVGDKATTVVHYRQGGRAEVATVALRRTGTTWLVKDSWQVTNAPLGETIVTVTGTLSGQPITVNGVRVGSAGSDGTKTFAAFPGTYRVGVASTKYFTATSRRLTVRAAAVGDAELTAKPTSALKTDAVKAVQSVVAKCAATTTASVPEYCPFAYDVWDDQATGVSFRITKQPTYTLHVYGDDDLEVSSDEGEVHVAFNDPFLGPTADDDSFQVDYRVRVHGDSVSVDTSDSY